MKIALTILTENPLRKTGLTSLFHELVLHGLKNFPDVSWLIFAGANQEWAVTDARVELIRRFPANDQLKRRLVADHFQVPPLARKHKADVLLTVGFVPVRKSLPTAMHILSLHALDKQNQLGFFRGLYRRWMMRFSWPKADLVFVNSRWTADKVLSVYPAFQDRVTVSYEGLQHELFNTVAAPDEARQLKKQFGIEPGYFLWLSNFYPYKQAELLIRGYSRLDPETRRRHPLVMAGGDWLNGLAAAQEQAKAIGVDADVKFLGWIDDRWVAPLYRHAAAFCLPSREETFGRCVIEAMACGVPCVVNDLPVMHEVTGGHALIADFHDEKVVSDALRRLVSDAGFVQQLRDGGLARARQFTFDKLATERITALQQLVLKKQRPC